MKICNCLKMYVIVGWSSSVSPKVLSRALLRYCLYSVLYMQLSSNTFYLLAYNIQVNSWLSQLFNQSLNLHLSEKTKTHYST